ncbi:MAG TPA: TIGR03620 family F420-dependent LLM class oxidoreductase [Steroidobacteraceae bacterium]|jgi:probable F420-dependent oxidoreductase|nr:TIGR03620 family F420-dependent LLM class oxidoreductase [Steroidobacteraceae bacterium]
MQISKLGVWANTDALTAGQAAAFAARVERWGYSVLWIPEGLGRNSLVHAAWLLANTERLIIATGIANLYARDAVAMRAAQLALAEQSNGRFLLGIGVSHASLVHDLRGHDYDPRPVERMRSYLEQMAAAHCRIPPPPESPPTVIAALGPKMLQLAGQMTQGAHPYNVTPEHTAQARQLLGPGKWLCPEQKVLLEPDPAKARAAARAALGFYLAAPNYLNNLRRLGFGDPDFAGGGSDRLVDALVAWGDIGAVRARIQAHWDAGADHVCVQTLTTDPSQGLVAHEQLLAQLAPVSAPPAPAVRA